MNCRLWSTVLFSVFYRTGKRNFVTTGMSSCLPKISEAGNFQSDIAENSSDTQRQGHVLDQLSGNGSVRSETSQILQNFIDASAHASTEGIQLSKRALKRLRRSKLKKEKQPKKSKTDDSADLQHHSDVIAKESLSETDYYFEDGLRKVYPYYFSYKTYVKKRWFGLPIVSVFVKEFQNYSEETIKRLVESQNITVNGSSISVDYILKNGDYIENYVHRHELPVTAEPIEILADTSELLVVNKPSSIPIHPCGRYRFNCLLYVLAKEKGFRNLRGLYRLDRLTSGIIIFSKTEAKTQEMMELIRKRQLQKEYVCRVDGEFPSGQVECNEPIDVLSYKLGVYRVGPGGKEARTVFERLSYNGQISIVKCLPFTGRTHQIRVHLQYLGFPIPNDPIYSGSVWGPNRGKGGDFGKSEEQLLTELQQVHSSSRYLTNIAPDTLHHQSSTLQQPQPCASDTHTSSGAERQTDDAVDSVVRSALDESSTARLPVFDSSRMTFNPECRDCQISFQHTKPDHLLMYLHAYRYQASRSTATGHGFTVVFNHSLFSLRTAMHRIVMGPDWCFTSPLPQWAQDDCSDTSYSAIEANAVSN